MEAGHPHVEAGAVETADELAHLSLGAPGMEAGDENRYRKWVYTCHVSQPFST
jgi:hypothetical protein